MRSLAIKKYLLFLFSIFLLHSNIGFSYCRDSIPASTPNSRFSVNGSEVTDILTKLIWKRCSHGQSGTDCSSGAALSLTWEDALLTAEAERKTTGKSWRLPNVNELRSIVEEKCLDPAINTSIFPRTFSRGFWSATPDAEYPFRALLVYFTLDISPVHDI